MYRRLVAGARTVARSFLWSLFALALCVQFSPTRSAAQGNSAQPPQKITEGLLVASSAEGRSLGLCPLAHTAVKAQISGFMSRVRVTQEFRNPYAEKIEAVYMFPLPENAAVDDMRIQVGDRVVVGRIMRRAEARQVYNQARAQGQVAALLDQERPNIFTQSVANIMPGEKIIVQISYVETLKYEDGAYEFVFPMVVGARYNPGLAAPNAETASTVGAAETESEDAEDIEPDVEPDINGESPQPSPSGSAAPAAIPPPVLPEGMRAGHDISLELDVDAGVPINEFMAKTHEVNVERQTASRALVRLKDEAVIPNKDFVFRYDVAGQQVIDAVLTHKDNRGGYFTMILQPPDRVTMADITPKELVFVVDTSGSMGGFPLEHARATILYALEHLNPGDTFNLITFSGDEHILFKEPVPATPANIAKAKKFLASRDAGGGTEMMKAIRASLDPSDAQDHLRIVCFATDGQVGNDQEIIAEVQKHTNARVFALGFGSSPNRFLLNKMAEYGRGEVDYVTYGEAGQKAAERFYERVRDPLLTNITIDWGGLPVTDVYPQRINDLFRSKPVVLSGRFSGDAKGTIRLRGMMSGREVVREIPVDLSAANDEHDTLATLWARRKIDDLMGQDYDGAARGQMKDGLNEAVTKLGLEYRLMTQFTSFVAVDESTVTPPVEPKKVDVAVESSDALLSTTIDAKSIMELPLLGRDPTALVLVAPGAANPGYGGVNVVTVAASGSTIDTTANTSGTNVSTEQFSNFPSQRTVQSLYSIAPTVSRSGLRDASGRDRDPSVGGSSGPENNYVLDGVNTSDPAFGGSGTNLPFEFVQEVEIKTGAYGAEYGKSTGGIFNVITKSGGNEFRGDAFGYFTTRGLVRSTKQFPFLGAAPDGFSEIDAGVDLGGPISKDKLWFFGAFNPQQRKNFFLTQTFRAPVENEITTPFYAGKVTWNVNSNHTFTFSTFGDFTKEKGFLFGGSGFGTDLSAFRGTVETGGHNYSGRMNSTFTPSMIGEFAFGVHLQRANTLPESATTVPAITDSFAVVRNGVAVAPTHSGVVVDAGTGTGDFINGANSTLARGLVRGPGFGLFGAQDRNRWEISARMQNIWGRHSFKYGFEYGRNSYGVDTISTGSPINYGGIQTLASRITNNFGVCVIQGTNIVCPVDSLRTRIQALLTAGVNLGGPTSVTTDPAIISQIATTTNPFLIRTSTRVRDFRLIAPSTHTNVESFYVQDEFKLTRNFTLNGGVRWDFQQSFGSDRPYVRLNNFKDNLQPRLGIIWDFTGEGKGKVYLNYARFLETPLPLDLNVRAGSDTTQTDVNFNVDTINAPAGSLVVADFGNLGASSTPIDPGLKPQSVNEFRGGFEYEVAQDLTVGIAGIYRAQGSVIEDGSFDDGQHYFLFNPGESLTNSLSCQPPPVGAGQCFGRARRYYRALEITAHKRFSNNFQFLASYVFSSLTGNYEGLFRNDNGQADPNITSLFDLVSLLNNSYGRLPNDRPHQFKFDGTYRLPFKLAVGASFRAQSGMPFNQLVPHPVYGDNEGFGVPRGTAVVPVVGNLDPAFLNRVDSIGSNRTPATWNLDLNAYYPIKVGDHRELRLQALWLNVFNHQRAVRLDETYQINSGIPGVANTVGNRLPNPFYGSGTIFQYPSSLSVGVKFAF